MATALILTRCRRLRWRRTVALGAVLVTAGCGGGGGDEPAASLPPPASAVEAPALSGSVVEQAAATAQAIVEASSARDVVQATRLALALGGVAQADAGVTQQAARLPEAAWTTDPALVFNLAAEAHSRAVAGRLTVDQLALMWADFGFPFNGSGTPGEQLLAFLRASLEGARATPDNAAGFMPALLAELVARQEPQVDLADPSIGPQDVRLSLLEVELLLAAWDRAFQPGAAPAASSGRKRALAADGFCAEMKAFYGKIAGKLIDKNLKYIAGQLNDKALAALGMSAAEIQAFGTYSKIFGALSSSLTVVKMAQIYAAGQVALTVEGANPVMKPPKNGARVLVPVKATAGVPEQEWRDYQQTNGSQTYQTVKSCLGSLGMPMPLDLKDIAAKVDGWRVAWELTSGAPEHALIPSDVNVFDASSSGHPFGMKLVRSGPVAADAKLQVDIREEPELATLLQGPLVTSNVRVNAKVFTAEPPSPAMLVQVTSLLGTIGAMVDLSAGWIQTMLPPTTNAVVKVQHHQLPQRLRASADVSMTFDYATLRGTPASYRHTIRGSAQGVLERSAIQFSLEDTAANYAGVIDFAFGSVGTQRLGEDDGCRHDFAYALRNGKFQMAVGPHYSLQNGQLVHHPESPSQLGFTGAEVPMSDWPAEQQTYTIDCGDGDVQTFERPMMPDVFVAAANTLNLIDTGLMTLGPGSASVDGWDLRNSRLLTDGTLELHRTTPRTVTVLVQDGGSTIALDTVVRAIDTVVRLKPEFAPAD